MANCDVIMISQIFIYYKTLKHSFIQLNIDYCFTANGGSLLVPQIPPIGPRIPSQMPRIQQHQQNSLEIGRRMGFEHDRPRTQTTWDEVGESERFDAAVGYQGVESTSYGGQSKRYDRDTLSLMKSTSRVVARKGVFLCNVF